MIDNRVLAGARSNGRINEFIMSFVREVSPIRVIEIHGIHGIVVGWGGVGPDTYRVSYSIDG